MPEIVENLTIAKFLLLIGVSVWLGGFKLAFPNQMFYNNRELS